MGRCKEQLPTPKGHQNPYGTTAPAALQAPVQDLLLTGLSPGLG